jgi:hypothetical protein
MRKINSKHIDTRVNHVFYYLFVLHAGPNVATILVFCLKSFVLLNCFLILFDSHLQYKLRICYLWYLILLLSVIHSLMRIFNF